MRNKSHRLLTILDQSPKARLVFWIVYWLTSALTIIGFLYLLLLGRYYVLLLAQPKF